MKIQHKNNKNHIKTTKFKIKLCFNLKFLHVLNTLLTMEIYNLTCKQKILKFKGHKLIRFKERLLYEEKFY